MPTTKIIVTSQKNTYHLHLAHRPETRTSGKSFYETIGALFETCKEIFSQEVTVTPRERDYHACIKNNPDQWGADKNPRAAIGNLINSHQKSFGVHIEWRE